MTSLETKDKQDLPEPAQLSRRALREVSEITQDVRLTVKRLEQPGCSPLAVVDGDSVDAIKDLYYVVTREDPNNVMPARKLLCEQNIVPVCLLPLLSAINSDPTAAENQKRWSVSLYHTFRVLSILAVPVMSSNEHLKPGCVMDNLLMDIRVALAREPTAVDAIVQLLQYYVERKAEKQARFAPAEESKIEDARIENILGFFRNVLIPPRSDKRKELQSRDHGVHFALVGIFADADLYSTLAILFSSRDEARAHPTDLLFTVADIYRYTYRLSSPKDVARGSQTLVKTETKADPSAASATPTDNAEKLPSVFDLPGSEDAVPAKPPRSKTPAERLRERRGAGLRDAMKRERTLLGGSRSVTTSNRWNSRHSGGFVENKKTTEGDKRTGFAVDAKGQFVPKRVVGAVAVVKAHKVAGEGGVVQKGFQLNSELLCGLASSGLVRKAVITNKNTMGHQIRADLLEKGRQALPVITLELIEISFQIFVRELRERIEQARGRPGASENEELARARRAFLAFVANVVGFQREYVSLEAKSKIPVLRRGLRMHKGDMEVYNASDVAPVGNKWLDIEAGIELMSFKMAFDVLLQFSELDKKGAEDVELATFAILQMMKMMQSMALHPEKDEDVAAEMNLAIQNGAHQKTRLTGREMALNTLEDLFTAESYLNAPCALAKDYNAKYHSFRHLANIVEVAHAFTSTLLDEKELGDIKVQRKKKKRKAKKKNNAEKTEEEQEAEQNADGDKDKSAVDENEKNDGEEKVNGADNESKDKENVEPEKIGEEPAAESAANGDKDSSPTKESSIAGVDEQDEGKSAGREKVSEKVLEGDGADKPSEETIEKKGAEEKTNDADIEAKGNETGEPVPVVEDDDANEDDEDSADEIIEDKVESTGVVRRFAHGRAMQVLSLPIRACLCKASAVSGAVFPVPEGAHAIMSSPLAAKSLAVLTAIWSTTGTRDRGALRGHFFSFPVLQLLSLCMNAATRKIVTANSIIARVSELGVLVTREFHEWLSVNPGLAFDCFLTMDKTTCCSYVHALYLKNTIMTKDDNAEDAGAASDGDLSGEEAVLNQIDERRARLEAENDDGDDDIIDDGDLDNLDNQLFPVEARTPSKRRTPNNPIPKARRRRPAVELQDEDADMDDVDALMIGALGDDDETGPTAMETLDALEKALTPKNLKKKRQARRASAGENGDLDTSDSDDSQEPGARAKKPAKKRRKGKKSKAQESAEKNKVYAESSDDMNEEDMKVFNVASDGEGDTTKTANDVPADVPNVETAPAEALEQPETTTVPDESLAAKKSPPVESDSEMLKPEEASEQPETVPDDSLASKKSSPGESDSEMLKADEAPERSQVKRNRTVFSSDDDE